MAYRCGNCGEYGHNKRTCPGTARAVPMPAIKAKYRASTEPDMLWLKPGAVLLSQRETHTWTSALILSIEPFDGTVDGEGGVLKVKHVVYRKSGKADTRGHSYSNSIRAMLKHGDITYLEGE